MTGGGTRRSVRLVAAAAALMLVVGCGGTSTPPQSVIPSPTPTEKPSTAPSPRPPSAAPSADPGSAVVRSFVAYATSPGATYQATFTGESRQSVTVIKITKGTLQGHGGDVLVRAVFTFPDKNGYVVEHRDVNGVAWFRVDTRPWQKVPAFTAANSMAAFASVHGPADVTYLGPKTVGGTRLYELSIPSAIVNPIMLPESNLSEAAVTSSKLTLLIDAKGRPVSGTGEVGGRGRVSGQLQEIAIDFSVAFTKVGGAVSIKAP
jgi:hypothetical protein